MNEELSELLRPGVSFSVYFNANNVNNKRVHIRALVDDEYVVYRYWRTQEWVYKVDHWYWFKLLLGGGNIKRVSIDNE